MLSNPLDVYNGKKVISSVHYKYEQTYSKVHADARIQQEPEVSSYFEM